MIKELAAYIRANGLSVEVESNKLIIRKNGHCYAWSLAPYIGASYIHRDILLNEADQTIQEIEDLISDGPQDPDTYADTYTQISNLRNPAHCRAMEGHLPKEGLSYSVVERNSPPQAALPE